MDTFDVAQICRGGHVVNSASQRVPERNQSFCSQCGEPTITQCGACHKDIRGDSVDDDGYPLGLYEKAPAYCRRCGKAFPWTTARLEAAKELVGTFEELSEDERGHLQESLEDLARDTPRTRVAESRFRKLMKKVAAEGYEGVKSILVEILSEATRRSLFGG